MTNRERVHAALRFEKTDIIPYHVNFTRQMLDKMIACSGNRDYYAAIDNHIAETTLIKPEIEVKPDFYMDEYGVVWNKSGVDKDIGVVDAIRLQDTTDLNAFVLPPVDEAFIRKKMEALMECADNRFRIANIGFSLFERAWTLRGMENLLCDMIEEPAFVHALLEKCGDYGNFVPSSGCDIPAHASWDNIQAFFAALER